MTDLGNFTTQAAGGPVTFSLDGHPMKAVASLSADVFGTFHEVANHVSRSGAVLNDDKATDDAKRAALNEFVAESIKGLDLVLFPESAEVIADRLKSKEHPISVPEIVQVFAALANHYTGTKDEEPARESEARPTEDGNALPSSSVTTGTGSTAPSSPTESPSTT